MVNMAKVNLILLPVSGIMQGANGGGVMGLYEWKNGDSLLVVARC